MTSPTNTITPRILVADDNEALSELLELILLENGYEVELAANGDDLLRKAQASTPDLMLVDIIMPYMDGYEAIRQLRNDTRLGHIPIIVLTARTSLQDVVVGFETGADDYITKPFQMPELLARIKAQLERAKRLPVQNPLTGLPGNTLIEEEINHRLRIEEPFALLYIDLDNFKAFNDTYGFARGDQVIKLLAQLLTTLKQTEANERIFIGHIGGDDFAVVLPPALVVPFCEHLIAQFDSQVPALYDSEDIQRGYLAREDRYHIMRQVPIQSLSIGVVTTKNRSLTSYHDLSRVVAEMKHLAKQQPGSVYVIDRRSRQVAVVEDRRKHRPTVLVTGTEGTIKDQVVAAFGQQMIVVTSYDPMTDPDEPDLVTVIGASVTTAMHETEAQWPALPIIVIACDDPADLTTAVFGMKVSIKPTLPIGEYLSLALHLLRLEAR